jgi:hypothetical protein
LLWDRRKVYEILKKIKLPLARHFFVSRSTSPEMT